MPLSSCTSSWKEKYRRLPQQKKCTQIFWVPSSNSVSLNKDDGCDHREYRMDGDSSVSFSGFCPLLCSCEWAGEGKYVQSCLWFLLSHQCRNPSWKDTGNTNPSKPENLVLMQMFKTSHAVAIWNNTLTFKSEGNYFIVITKHKYAFSLEKS